MIKIYDKELLNEFIEKFQINGLFSEDMTQDMELVLWNKSEYICQESESLNYLYFINTCY